MRIYSLKPYWSNSLYKKQNSIVNGKKKWCNIKREGFQCKNNPKCKPIEYLLWTVFTFKLCSIFLDVELQWFLRHTIYWIEDYYASKPSQICTAADKSIAPLPVRDCHAHYHLVVGFYNFYTCAINVYHH